VNFARVCPLYRVDQEQLPLSLRRYCVWDRKPLVHSLHVLTTSVAMSYMTQLYSKYLTGSPTSASLRNLGNGKFLNPPKKMLNQKPCVWNEQTSSLFQQTHQVILIHRKIWDLLR
jgi:hypothetical protein